jgi:drug/metabolite transporter (DMT)-like permease
MPPHINRTMTSFEWALLILLALLWGGSYFYNAVALQALPPLTIVAVRAAGGALILYLVVRARGLAMPRDADTWRGFFTMGFLNNVVPFILIVWGQSHIASGLASILNATTPLFGVLVAHLMTHDERMTPARVGGVVVGFSGVVVMIGPDALAGATADVMAEIALLVASVFYAISGVYGRRFGRAGLAPMVTATGQITAASVILVPLALLFDQPWMLAMPGWPVWGSLFGLAAISTALAYVMYYRILATAGAVNLLLVTFLVPVSAILLGALILHEHLAFRHFAGVALIGLGLAAIDGRLLRFAARARA